MSFIRVTDAQTKIKIDINSDHITGFMAEGLVTKISLINGAMYSVIDTPRSIRAFIAKANGKFAAEPASMDA